MNPHFWKDKKVFLTGHTGFKGGWLSLWLQSMQANVIGYSLPPTSSPNFFEVCKVSDHMDNIYGDIRDFKLLSSTLKKYQPEIVIHMAAQPLVRRSYHDPIETYSTNVMGTVNLLESVRISQSVKAVLNVTTDKCYENKEWEWGYRENEPLGGFDPYSSSKGCSELVSSAYKNSFFNNIKSSKIFTASATARAGNVIGGGDWAIDRLIPDIIKAFEKNEPVYIRNMDAIRPWQHVLEPLRGYLTLLEKLYVNGAEYSEAWNFGPNDEDVKNVGNIVKEMVSLWGRNVNWKISSEEQPHEATFLKLDISKARRRLEWHPTICLNDALKLVVDWYNMYYKNCDMRNFTLDQISVYQNLN